MALRAVLRTATLRGLLSSRFIREVLETYSTRIFIVALGFVNSILVTRLLGPDGRGMLAVANTVAATGVQLGNLGLQSSNTYYVSRDPKTLPTLLGNTLAVSAAGAVVTLAAFFFIQVRPEIAPIRGLLLTLSFLAIPAGLVSLLLQNLLIGTQQIHAYNVIDFTTRVLAVLLVASTVPWGLASPEIIFVLVLSTVVLGSVWSFVHLRRSLTGPVRLSISTLRGSLTYGLRAYFGSLFVFLVLKSDIVLVKYLRGAEDTGYYAVAAGLADILLILPTVVGTVLFPKLSAAPDIAARWAMTRRVLMVMFPATPVVLLVTFLVAGPLIHLAYGAAFDPSTVAVAWLLPGVGFYAINSVFMNLFASCGMPLVVVYSPLIALLVNVAMNLQLVPSMGFVGASISSSAAYGLMLVMSLLYARFRLLRGSGA